MLRAFAKVPKLRATIQQALLPIIIHGSASSLNVANPHQVIFSSCVTVNEGVLLRALKQQVPAM